VSGICFATGFAAGWAVAAADRWRQAAVTKADIRTRSSCGIEEASFAGLGFIWRTPVRYCSPVT